MRDFIPPMPPRLSDQTPLVTQLMKARENLLAGWTEGCFQWKRFEISFLNQRYIVCNNPDLVRHVFLDAHDNYDQKSPQMRKVLAPLLGDGLFISDGDLWRQRREICAPAMRPDLLPHFAPIMVRTTEELAADWQARAGSITDVLADMGQLTARIIGRTIFGDDTPAEEAEKVVRGFAEYQASIEQLDLASTLGLPALNVLAWLKKGVDQRAARDVHGVIDRIIARKKMAGPNDHSTLLVLFSEAARQTAGSACPFTDEALRNEAIVMFMAGHETTANTLAWAWHILGASPSHAAQLHQELDNVLGNRPPTLDDVERLPYTRALIEETLRLYPPVPVMSRQARKGLQFRKLEVRAGDIMLVVPWLLHRHDLYWEAPNAFRPERFMPGAQRPDRFIYLPFSVGHRVCLGQRFGLTEAILCLALLAQRFELTAPVDSSVEVSCRLTLRPKGGLPMRIRMRPSA